MKNTLVFLFLLALVNQVCAEESQEEKESAMWPYLIIGGIALAALSNTDTEEKSEEAKAEEEAQAGGMVLGAGIALLGLAIYEEHKKKTALPAEAMEPQATPVNDAVSFTFR